ncbi:serine hydrolase [Marinimicrobium alkaliphilum]|uniref:serine hydrolase n=1 Tax=Marinimicrobium alkaliphilum TaxID=2202654 RepID=UPI0013005ADF|nr:serine hydrolase [Marinimicrobium alkaliphilum]
MKRYTCSVLILLVTVISACDSKPAHENRIEAIEAAISPLLVVRGEAVPAVSLEDRMKQLNVPAVSIAVIRDGEVEWAKAYGLADKEDGVPATTDTLFQAASLSKPIAALAALKLVEDGHLYLDRDVNDSLTSWKIPENEFTANQKVTLRGLLNHSSGTTVGGFPGYTTDTTVPATVEVLEGGGNTEAVRVGKEPGESWGYSGGGYTVMQLLMSDVSGQPFPGLMRSIVLEPLDMKNSTYEQPLPEEWHARAASGYDGKGNKIVGRWHVYPEMAAAGLWTTPTDIARYIVEVQRAYADTGRVLSGDSARMMLKAGMQSHGLGPIIEDDGERFGHGGSNAGFRTIFTAFVEQGAGAIVMTNSDSGGHLAQELMLTIAREYGWPGIKPREKTTITLSEAAYKRFVGLYQIQEHQVPMEITYEGGRLFTRIADGETRELLPEAEHVFFTRDGMLVEFVSDDDIITGLVIGRGFARADKVDAQ